MKRNRQPDLLEEEPLAKRIHNLHLDNPGFPSPSSSPVQFGSLGEQHNFSHSINPSLVSDAAYTNNNNSDMKDAHLMNQISSTLGLICNDAQLQSTVLHTYHSLHKMIEERDFPESLSANYPERNPTDNNYYYTFNRLLHALHLERLRRQGKI